MTCKRMPNDFLERKAPLLSSTVKERKNLYLSETYVAYSMKDSFTQKNPPRFFLGDFVLGDAIKESSRMVLG